jgi:HSP20 family molecular chaperone IbpA
MSQREFERLMWSQALEMLDRAERLRKGFFQPASSTDHKVAWEPPVDVFETTDAIWLIMALPGVEPNRVEIQLKGRGLVVAGERHMPASLRNAAIHRLELPYGHFKRRLDLPPRPLGLDGWHFEHGCLLICLRKL